MDEMDENYHLIAASVKYAVKVARQFRPTRAHTPAGVFSLEYKPDLEGRDGVFFRLVRPSEGLEDFEGPVQGWTAI